MCRPAPVVAPPDAPGHTAKHVTVTTRQGWRIERKQGLTAAGRSPPCCHTGRLPPSSPSPPPQHLPHIAIIFDLDTRVRSHPQHPPHIHTRISSHPRKRARTAVSSPPHTMHPSHPFTPYTHSCMQCICTYMHTCTHSIHAHPTPYTPRKDAPAAGCRLASPGAALWRRSRCRWRWQ